jgi:predicted dehydrogenase
MGEAATLTYRDGHLTILSPDSEEMEIGPLPPASNPDENFVRAIQGREEPACSIEDGLRVLELTEAAWESAREHRPAICYKPKD